MDKTLKNLVNKIFQFDDNSSITFLFEDKDTLEIVLQGKTDSGFTSANVKLTKEETIQFVEWIRSQNH
jgi:hypothetical protein